MCCTVPLTPCVGVSLFLTGSDSPHSQQGERFTEMSERVTRREGFTRLTTRFRIRSSGATSSSYLAPSWVEASGLDMNQKRHHPKDWLSGGLPFAVNQLNWSAVPFNTRFFWYAVFFPWLVGRRRLSMTVVLTRYASYYYFFLRCWIGQ